MTDIDKLLRDLRQPGGDDARDRELSDQFAVALGWIIGTGNNSRSISVPFDKYDEATLRADIERRVREAMEA